MTKRKKLNIKGFSLVEAVMALGIVSFTVVPLLALLSIGLNNTRTNFERTVEAQIVGWTQGYIRSQGAAAPDSHSASFDEFGISAEPDKAFFTTRMTSRTIALPGSSSTLKAWNVVVSSAARGDQDLGEHVVWDIR